MRAVHLGQRHSEQHERAGGQRQPDPLTAPDLKAAAGSSAKGTLTLGNVNDGPITISQPPAITPAGSPFSVSDNKCTGSLASETTCIIEVTFSPPKGAAAGAQSATLTVNYQVNGAASKTVLLAGTVQ